MDETVSLHEERALCAFAGAGPAEDEDDFVFADCLRGREGGREEGKE